MSYKPPSKLQVLFQNILQNNPDPLFSFFRFFKPNIRLPGGIVMITRFRDVKEILDLPGVFNVPYKPMIVPSVGDFMLAYDNTVFNQRDKGIMRSLIQDSDMPRVRESVKEIASAAIQEGTVNGSLEVVSKLSRLVPVRLTGRYFGFPGPDDSAMMRWSRATQYDMFHNQFNDPVIHDANIQAGKEMRDYLIQYLPEKRAAVVKNPSQDDIVARLIKLVLPEEIGFDEQRMLSNIMGLLVGGVETTSQAIVQILDQFFNRPSVLKGAAEAARSGNDPLLYRYCWEALRFNPINPGVFRLCVQDYRVAKSTLRSLKIKKGNAVLVATRSAMRDCRELKSPGRFRLDRPEFHYFHVGYGQHTCLGDQVARVEIPEIIKQLLLQKNLRRAPGADGKINFDNGPFPERFVVEFG